MKLWIDNEFNGYRGPLISMALVDEDGLEWYESLGCANPVPWVAANVMPVIDIMTTTETQMQESLERFLGRYPSVHLIADWPADIELFCAFIHHRPGECLNLPPLTFEIARWLDAPSLRPHNALADARALRRAWRFRCDRADAENCDSCAHRDRDVEEDPCRACRVSRDGGTLTHWKARQS